MNSKTLIAAVIGGICSFLLGWLFYGILFRETLAGMAGSAQGVMKSDDELIFWALLLGNLLIAYLVAYVFSTWAGITTFAAGAQAGAMIGLLFTLGFNMVTYAVTNMMTLSGALLDVVISVVMWAISSGLVGWWLGRK
jgi:L-cysteine desulfidase